MRPTQFIFAVLVSAEVPKTNIMQKFIVEIFNKNFVKVAHHGPLIYKKAHKEAERLKLDGFQVLITEEEMVTDDAEWV